MDTIDAIIKIQYTDKGYKDPRIDMGKDYLNSEAALFEMLYDSVEDCNKDNLIDMLITIDRIKVNGYNKYDIVRILKQMDGGFYE